MANKYATLKDLFTAIANAIRSKTGSTSTIIADDFPDAISEITVNSGSSADFSVVTAGAEDVRSTKYFLNSSGVKTKGTLTTRTSSSVTASANKVTIPAGIYDSQVTKTITTATQATPSITVANGEITAKSTQTAGYVIAGTKTATKKLTDCDANLKAENIVSGVSIFGVTGTAEVGSTSGGNITGTELVYKQVYAMVYPDYASTYVTLNLGEKIGAVGAIELIYSNEGTGLSDLIERAYLIALPVSSSSNQYYFRGALLLGDGACEYIDTSYNPITIDRDSTMEITLDLDGTNYYFINGQYGMCCVYGAVPTS